MTTSGLSIGIDEAKQAVHSWRRRYTEIVKGWRTAGNALKYAASGLERAVDPWGLVHTVKNGLRLPSGRIIFYPDLRTEACGRWPTGGVKIQWVYANGRHKRFLTGPKTCENIVQALSRDSIFDVTVEFYRQTGLRPVLRIHDELVYVVKKSSAEKLLEILQHIMRIPPSWWQQLIVWSEGAISTTYGGAK
jgi:hypothetical protein